MFDTITIKAQHNHHKIGYTVTYEKDKYQVTFHADGVACGFTQHDNFEELRPFINKWMKDGKVYIPRKFK